MLLQAAREAQWRARRDILALALRREELRCARETQALALLSLQQQQQFQQQQQQQQHQHQHQHQHQQLPQAPLPPPLQQEPPLPPL